MIEQREEASNSRFHATADRATEREKRPGEGVRNGEYVLYKTYWTSQYSPLAPFSRFGMKWLWGRKILDPPQRTVQRDVNLLPIAMVSSLAVAVLEQNGSHLAFPDG